MNVEVRYFSKGGNTRRLAEAIAQAVGAQAETVETPLSGRADVLFLGASVYGGLPDKSVVAFIKQNAANIGRIVVFSTSATGRSTHARLKATAGDAGVAISDAWFHCPGAWTLFHKNRPNAEDCANAAAFARAQLQ